MGELQQQQTTSEVQLASMQVRIEDSLNVLANLQSNHQLSSVEGNQAIESFAFSLADSVPEEESIQDHLNYYKDNGLDLSTEQEQLVIDNAEFKKYGVDAYIDRTIQQSIINTVVRDAALRRVAGGELDADFIDDTLAKTKLTINKLADFLDDKNAGQYTIGLAKSKAADYLEKTVKYYTNHDVLDQNEQSGKRQTTDRLRVFGQTILNKVGESGKKVVEAGKSVVEKLTPTKKFMKSVGGVAAASLVVVGGLRAADSISEVIADSGTEVTAEDNNTMTTVETEENVLLEESNVISNAALPVAENAEPDNDQANEAVEEVAVSSTDSLSETDAVIPVETTAVEQISPEPEPYTPQIDTIRALQSGEKLLSDMQGMRLTSMHSDKLCLEDVLVYGSNRSDLNDSATLDLLQENNLLSDEERRLFESGAASSALKADVQQRFDPVYDARHEVGSQEDCDTGIGTDRYPARWNRTPQGSTLASNMASIYGVTLADVKPIVELDTQGGVIGMPGNAVIAGHRTTESAPFANIDALVAGDEVSFYGDDQELYTYVVESTDKVLPDAAGYQAILNYQSPSGIIETMTMYTCDDGSDTRYLVRLVLKQA